ncbi:MAG TPA: DegT/DnrJ/EryC1/StrS family aminotransferase, partial [Acidimicrobiales bacterium]|nr:DegT/DnrJ/EryC1/StrS family aminotransferase [Acidimicrobiales bacterium]
EVLRSGQTTMGDRVAEFEERFARYVGAAHAVMVNSGSSADLLMAVASRHRLGKVILPVVTWPTHVWSWSMAGSDIHFVDVDGLNTTQELVEEAITSPHDMVSLVHLMGIPADVSDLGCRVTEDCCEALGSQPVARQGEMATWSFFFSHHMTTMEGGMVTTDNPATASHLRSLRSHGWARHEGRDPFEFVTMGFNLRPTEISAAIGLVQLGRLDGFNKLRAENHRLFTERLAGCPGIELPAAPEGTAPSWFGLPFFADRRDELGAFLESQGVETRPILGGSLARQPAFRSLARGEFPGADKVHDHGIYIGLHPVADCGVSEVAELIAGFLG